MKPNYNDMSFMAPEPERTLTKIELEILSKILNSIKKGNINETLIKIYYTDNYAFELWQLIDKIDFLNK